MSNCQLSTGNYQLPEGYQQTEVGVIPEDWETKKLGDFVSLQRGYDLTANERRPGNVPVMGAAGQNGYHNTALVQSPGLVLGRSGASFGQVHYCDKDYWPHNTGLYATDFHGNDPRFAFYFLDALDFNRYNSGGAQQSLNRNFIYPIPVAIPTIEEQRSIAQALSDVDRLIAALEKAIAKKRAIKTATMQQLLTGKKRLPGFGEGKGYKESAISVIPKDWEIVKLGDILKIRHGKSQHEVLTPNGIYPILATGGEIGRTNTPLYDHPSVLIGRKGTIDIPRYMDTPFWTVDTLFYSEISRNTDAKFVFYKFNLIDWYSYNEASGVPSLNAATIENIEQAFPTLKEEQQAIATVLSDMDTAIAALETRLAKTQSIKQGMMQALLTGRVRLKIET